MTLDTFLQDLRARGVRFAATDGNLRIDAPRGVLTEQDREQLRRHRHEVLDWVGGVRATTSVPTKIKVLGPDAVEQFLDRLGRADDLGLDTSPGSLTWQIALREARRVAAGLPPEHHRTRDPDVLDAAIDLFTPAGGQITARRLAPEEIAEFRGEPGGASIGPPGPCHCCGHKRWWRFPGQEGWTCDHCARALHRDRAEFIGEDGGPTP
jgi:hypothetical protein